MGGRCAARKLFPASRVLTYTRMLQGSLKGLIHWRVAEGLSLAAEALQALAAYHWPGNVRELRNVILRAAATAPGEVIEAADLHFTEVEPAAAPAGPPPARLPDGVTLREALDARERDALAAALEAAGWNCSRAAAQLGVSRMTLYRRMARHGLTRPAH